VLNLYDLTKGTYRVFRAVSYPDYPDSLVLFDVEVRAEKSEWATSIYVNGAYDGPTDVVATQDYQLEWRIDDRKLLESGAAELLLSSGARVRQSWSSIITPVTRSAKQPAVFRKFPREGELANLSISPFKVAKRTLRYEWEGTVKKASENAR
jgi:hypothetical protein